MDKSERRKFIEEIVHEECKGKDCLLKDISSRLSLSADFFEQYKCNKKFKYYEVSQERREAIEDISPNECKGKNCLPKEVILRGHLNGKRLELLKCIENYKKEKEEQGEIIDFQKVALLFINNYWKEFDKAYQDATKNNRVVRNGELYHQVMQGS